jgi:ABC-type multidrug transport system fused ATPase/permease subunit
VFESLKTSRYGGSLVLGGEITMGSLTTYIVYSFSVAKSFEGLSNLYFETIRAFGATERIYSLIFRKPEIEVNRKGEIIKNFKGVIEFENVNFYYQSRPNQIILNNFSLKLEPGKVIALVGGSGGGKSTVSKLIQQFYNKNSGEILVDGIRIEDLDYQWYREKFACVDQEPSLFGYSIEENIAFGSTDPFSKLKVVEAAKSANAHEFIMSLEHGYQTKIGERGVQLSGGQKQRIAIARGDSPNQLTRQHC